MLRDLAIQALNLAMLSAAIVLVPAVPTICYLGVRLLMARGSEARAKAKGELLGQLAETGRRLGAQINTAILSNPSATAAIDALKTTIVNRAATEFAAKLEKVGGTREGMESIILSGAAMMLPAQAAQAAQASALDPTSPNVDVQAASAALAKLTGIDLAPFIAAPRANAEVVVR